MYYTLHVWYNICLMTQIEAPGRRFSFMRPKQTEAQRAAIAEFNRGAQWKDLLEERLHAAEKANLPPRFHRSREMYGADHLFEVLPKAGKTVLSIKMPEGHADDQVGAVVLGETGELHYLRYVTKLHAPDRTGDHWVKVTGEERDERLDVWLKVFSKTEIFDYRRSGYWPNGRPPLVSEALATLDKSK